MMSARLACLKHITLALLALILLICGAEVAMRAHLALREPEPRPVDDVDPTIPCRQLHHRLAPLSSHEIRNPDTGRTVTLLTNSAGLRGPEAVVPKPPGTYRIVCLGDEIVLGPDVEWADTFTARLQDLLASQMRGPVEVVNAGVPGYAPLLSALQVRHSLLALQPDLLILNIEMADIADDHRYRRFAETRDAAVLACPNPEFAARSDHPLTRLHDSFLLTQWCARKAADYSAERMPDDLEDIDTAVGRYAWLSDSPPDWSVYIDQALSPIATLRDLAAAVNAQLIVVMTPAPWQVSATATDGPGVRAASGVPAEAVYRSRMPFEAISGVCRRENVSCCDLSPAFLSFDQPERLYLDHAPRLTPLGHELYARELADFLSRAVPGVWTDRSWPTGNPLPRAARPNSSGRG